MSRRGAGGLCDYARGGGFTLVELLIAASVVAVVLGAAYAWLWNVAALAGGVDDRVQAATLAAAVSRAVTADVRGCLGVTEPPPARDPSRSIALVHSHPDSAAETVLTVWDPSRRVVWRNSSGTYLADHVTLLAVKYFLADGSLVGGGSMAHSDWTSVRAVRVDLTTTVGSASARRSVVASVGLP